MLPPEFFQEDFHVLPEIVALHARQRPDHRAVIHRERSLSYAQLNALADRVAAGLQRDGLKSRDVIAICASTSIEYLTVFLGALRAGVAVTPLAPSSTPQSLLGMIDDCGATLLFLDAGIAADLAEVTPRIKATRIALDGSDAGRALDDWLPMDGTRPEPVEIDPQQPFNIIYSSGTTGAPKGIIQSYRMRWMHVRRGFYSADAVTLISTPFYSNTTLVSVFPTLAHGGTLVLMAKFDVEAFLTLAQKYRVTHAILVPVQYKRLMEYPDFDKYDLSSFVTKFCTSAPFSVALKQEVMRRWPGGLVEYFGMTEGGCTFILEAHLHPDKLHTVGKPAPGHRARLINDAGEEVAPGEIGEIVGTSASMMNAYHNLPDRTAAAEWYDADGVRHMRMGDIGRFDADGFLTLMDRKKDMIISGGFNIYPSDLEAVVAEHDAVGEVAVVGVQSGRWGETPVAYVALKPGAQATADDIRTWANARLGKMQRIADVVIVEALLRNHIGKVMKKELRETYVGPATA